MPQKKKPDIAEPWGKSWVIDRQPHGPLATLNAAPGLQTGSRRQEDEPVFDLPRQLEMVLPAMAGLSRPDLRRRPDGRPWPRQALPATDVAEWLVRRGVPFRIAPRGRPAPAVRTAEGRGSAPRGTDRPEPCVRDQRDALTPRCGRCAERVDGRSLGTRCPRRHRTCVARQLGGPAARRRMRDRRELPFAVVALGREPLTTVDAAVAGDVRATELVPYSTSQVPVPGAPGLLIGQGQRSDWSCSASSTGLGVPDPSGQFQPSGRSIQRGEISSSTLSSRPGTT